MLTKAQYKGFNVIFQKKKKKIKPWDKHVVILQGTPAECFYISSTNETKSLIHQQRDQEMKSRSSKCKQFRQKFAAKSLCTRINSALMTLSEIPDLKHYVDSLQRLSTTD